MTRQELLLTQLAEECAEVAQRVSKALRFGLEEIQPGQSLNNAERIVEELIDLQAVWRMLQNEPNAHAGDGFARFCILPVLSLEAERERMLAKIAKVEKFLAFSAARGRVDGIAADASVPHPEAVKDAVERATEML